MTTPGPYPVQNQSLPHEIIIDPTGNYVLVPDLGADLVRVLTISRGSNEVQECQVIQLPRGSTPRHGPFAQVDGNTYFYVLEQNANKLMSYSVKYLLDGTMAFKELDETNLLLEEDEIQRNGTIQSSEIVVSVSSFLPSQSSLENFSLGMVC